MYLKGRNPNDFFLFTGLSAIVGNVTNQQFNKRQEADVLYLCFN